MKLRYTFWTFIAAVYLTLSSDYRGVTARDMEWYADFMGRHGIPIRPPLGGWPEYLRGEP